jgi:hypothetical protein
LLSISVTCDGDGETKTDHVETDCDDSFEDQSKSATDCDHDGFDDVHEAGSATDCDHESCDDVPQKESATDCDHDCHHATDVCHHEAIETDHEELRQPYAAYCLMERIPVKICGRILPSSDSLY